MSPSTATIDVYLAVYPNPPWFNHWAVFIDTPDVPILLQAKGSEGRFRFEDQIDENPRNSDRKPSLILVATMKYSIVHDLRCLAQCQPLNRRSGWNCQDFVVELLESAGIEGFIELQEGKMAEIVGMVDGLE